MEKQPTWSSSEKSIARRIFDGALGRELDEITTEARRRVERIKAPSELWDLEAFLTKRRKDVDRKYDYRYSQLPIVFAELLRQGRISEDDLHGLRDDKLGCVRWVLEESSDSKVRK
jgi:hypothetical protein